ncbi:MAG: helix-turn-helix domain-containing protein [Pirellulales bacterium]
MAASRYLPVRDLAAWPIPRVNCPKHGVKQVLVPWAEPGGRFSILFETHVLEVLEACQNTTAACRILGISWDQDWGLKELLCELWEHATPDKASEFFLNWYRRVIHGKLEPM